MKKKFGFLRNKRGSGLVEKIMLTAFAVAAGGAVIVYTSNVVIEAKNHNVPGLNLTEDGGTLTSPEQFVIDGMYQFSGFPTLNASEISAQFGGSGNATFYISEFYNNSSTPNVWGNSYSPSLTTSGYYKLIFCPNNNFPTRGTFQMGTNGPNWYPDNINEFKFVYKGHDGDITKLLPYLIKVS